MVFVTAFSESIFGLDQAHGLTRERSRHHPPRSAPQLRYSRSRTPRRTDSRWYVSTLSTPRRELMLYSGLLNASLGNAVELIIAILALWVFYPPFCAIYTHCDVVGSSAICALSKRRFWDPCSQICFAYLAGKSPRTVYQINSDELECTVASLRVESGSLSKDSPVLLRTPTRLSLLLQSSVRPLPASCTRTDDISSPQPF